MIALSSSSIATRTAASKKAGLGRLDVQVGIDRLGQPALRAGALEPLLTLRVPYTCWLLRRISARRTGFLTILVAALGPEMLQRFDKAATSTGAHPHGHAPHSVLA